MLVSMCSAIAYELISDIHKYFILAAISVLSYL